MTKIIRFSKALFHFLSDLHWVWRYYPQTRYKRMFQYSLGRWLVHWNRLDG